jgi:hypothetical protein
MIPAAGMKNKIWYNYSMGVSIGSTIWKRKYPRVNLEMKGDFSLLLPEMDKERIPAEVKTLGGGGIMFISPLPLSIGTPLRVRIFHWANVVKFTSRVVWSEPIVKKESTGFQNGVQFEQISNETLVQIRNIMQTWMNKLRES